MKKTIFISLSLLAFVSSVAASPIATQPVAPVRPVTDTYFGTKVTDPYRWMEDRSAPEFINYMLAQGRYARSVLDKIPGRQELQNRIAAHTGGGIGVSNVQIAGDHIFYLKRQPDENTFKLFVRATKDAPERLLVDPDSHATEGHHFAIDYYQPSQKGEEVAYGISPGGSEHSVIHALNVASGTETPETIDRAENGAPAWCPDGKSFFYNRMVAVKPGDPDTARYLNSKVYWHRLGTDPEKDIPLIGAGVAGSPEVTPVDVAIIQPMAGTPYALALISHGSVPAIEVLIAPLADARKPGARWRKIVDTPEGVTGITLHDDTLYMLSHQNAPRYKVVALDVRDPDWSKAKPVVAPSERVIQDVQQARDGLYIHDLDGGLGKLRFYDFAKSKLSDVALPAQGAITGTAADPLATGAVFGLEGWVLPLNWYAATGTKVTPLALSPAWADNYSAFVAEEVQAPAKDGVMIPLSIVHRRDLVKNGREALWISAYGAYGIPLSPYLSARYVPLMEDGGVYAICHVRGGGEFGEEWHLAGYMATKPNTYRDLIACTEYLQKNGYGSPSTTAIESRSAGGITVGMAAMERPDLFRVLFSGVGDSNALRAEFETDGEANAL